HHQWATCHSQRSDNLERLIQVALCYVGTKKVALACARSSPASVLSVASARIRLLRRSTTQPRTCNLLPGATRPRNRTVNSTVSASQPRAIIAWDIASSKTVPIIPPCTIPSKLSHPVAGIHVAVAPSNEDR